MVDEGGNGYLREKGAGEGRRYTRTVHEGAGEEERLAGEGKEGRNRRHKKGLAAKEASAKARARAMA